MSRFFLFAIALWFASQSSADERSPSVRKKTEANRIAKSNEQLSALVVSAIDSKDYAGLMQLMLPASVLQDTGAPPEILKQYDAYLQSIPKMAEQYRSYLAAEKRLPLAQWKFLEVKPDDPKTMNGLTVVFSSGIRLTDADRKDGFELVDQSVGIDGRWYILRLCNEKTEERLSNQAEGPK